MQYITRIASIALGCGLCKVLSWSFPDPEEILDQQAKDSAASAEKPNNESPPAQAVLRENIHQQHDMGIMSSSTSFDRYGATSTGKIKHESISPMRLPQSSSLTDDNEQHPLMYGGSSYDHGNAQGVSNNVASSKAVSEINKSAVPATT
jgi:hypothetical protein